MPSRVKSINLTGMPLDQDLTVVSRGTRVSQVSVVTLPSTAAGTVGLRIGSGADLIRLNAQGQVINLDGDDAIGGIFLAWMGLPAPFAIGIVEFALGGVIP